MIEFLLAVPGRTKKLLDRLTTTRAANLDYLNDFISTRAPQATAVSNADATVARLSKLDTVIVSSVLNSNIQTGYVNAISTAGAGEDPYYTDVAVANVANWNTKAWVFCMNIEAGQDMSARLTSATNLRVSGSQFARGRWYIIEFK